MAFADRYPTELLRRYSQTIAVELLRRIEVWIVACGSCPADWPALVLLIVNPICSG